MYSNYDNTFDILEKIHRKMISNPVEWFMGNMSYCWDCDCSRSCMCRDGRICRCNNRWGINLDSCWALVYVAEFNKDEESGLSQVLFDFYTLADYAKFYYALSRQGKQESAPIKNNSTFILLQNFNSSETLQPDEHYYLNILDLIDNVNFEKTNTEGFMLAAMLSFNADNEHSQAIADLMFLHADPQVYPQYVYSSLMSFLPKPSDVSLSKSELILHDVKQGCFCEIRKDDRPYVIFDAGTEVLRTDAPFFSLLNDLKSAIGQQPLPIMVLSHWHTDHYSLLFSLRDNELQQIEHAYVPTAVKHASIDLLIHRLAFNSKYITVVPDPAPSNRKDVQLNNCLHLYANKVRKSVTNNSGLILFAQGSNNSVLFPGDCNYQYAERAANDSNTSSVRVNYHYLVVPHHGGKAGVVRYKVTNANFVNALVSVGPNKPHNHPFDSVLNQLLNDVSSIEMTKYHGDISKPL